MYVRSSADAWLRVFEAMIASVLYVIQLEVCTVYSCARSKAVSVTTAESVPDGLAAPTVVAWNSSSLLVSWTAPRHSNGIIVNYHLSRTVLVTSCT